MFKLSQAVFNTFKNNNRSLSLVGYQQCLKSTIAVEAKTSQTNIFSDVEEQATKPKQKSQNSMVAAAFAALQPNMGTDIKTPITDDRIYKASNVDELLSISEGNGVSRRHALKVVSTLADWSSKGRANLSDFENDARFIKLCRILTKGNKINRNEIIRSEDLSTVLSVTADDEAARLVGNLTLSQAVKVMTTLSEKKRRSVLLLRSLAYNITASCEQLNLKQSADLLYSMCILNFPDDNLLAKVCGDINSELGTVVIKKSSVIGSIITSLGLLRYKNCEILDSLSDWIFTNQTVSRPQDIFSLFITLATLNHIPPNGDQFFKTLLPHVCESEARKPLIWLNLVWALVLLNQATSAHISSVLAEDFVNKIEGQKSLNMSARLKLLNINGAAAHLLENYHGATLPPASSIHNVNLGKTKEKTVMVQTVVDTLKNLIQSEHLSTNINTDLGFYIDVKCILDRKCNPLPIQDHNEERSDVTRVAIMVFDYHDMCHGKIEPLGVNAFACKLLEAQGYKVLVIPYTEFKITDKLVSQVQYLETKLKSLVK